MITEILSRTTCADCRMCCVFDRYDIWETPVFTEETRDLVLNIQPDAKFAKVGSGYFLNAGEITDGELYSCPALTETGCALGDDKPFDCRIWPFRIMNYNDQRVIAVSRLCDAVHGQPIEKLAAFLKKGLGRTMLDYADVHPEAVKPHYDNYTVVLTESEL